MRKWHSAEWTTSDLIRLQAAEKLINAYRKLAPGKLKRAATPSFPSKDDILVAHNQAAGS